MTRQTVDLRCPNCARWLAEVKDFGRAVCPNCGWEVSVRSKCERDSGSGLTKPNRPANNMGEYTA